MFRGFVSTDSRMLQNLESSNSTIRKERSCTLSPWTSFSTGLGKIRSRPTIREFYFLDKFVCSLCLFSSVQLNSLSYFNKFRVGILAYNRND